MDYSNQELANQLLSKYELLKRIINKNIDIFCYPYGGKVSYNQDTLKILKKLKFKLAYSVEPKDITLKYLKNQPYELPSYDCNLF